MTKVRTYRIDVDDNAQVGDAIVISTNGNMTSQHLGTAASADTGICPGNVPVLNNNWELPTSTSPSSVMKKCIYDPNNKAADVYDYCNFDNTPEIPVVNNPQVTFTQGWVTVWTISLNQAWDTTVNLLAGGVSAGKAIDITDNTVSVKFDECSIDTNDSWELQVVNYWTIVCWAAAWATAVQADDLATVAMTGNYCDLINKPDIPSAQVQSDWDEINTNLPQYIKNKPTIWNATITLQKNGTNVDCFELNQTANKCLNLTLNKCDVWLSNVDNTSDADKPISDAAQCALNCKQDSISDLNTIRSNACAGKTASDTISEYWDIVNHNVCEFATAAQGWKADSAVQPWDLCTVATSAQYCDLIWQPTIPTDNSQLANGCGYITNAVNNLTNYYLKCETYQKCEVDNLIANFWWFEVVATLPTQNIKTNVIYLKWPIWAGTDRYEEWIYYNNTWTLIWETSTDLSNYAKCSDIPTNNNQLANGCWYTTCTWTLVASDLTPYAKTCNLCTVATSGKYCDLTWRPSLCAVATSAKYCDLTWTPVLCNVATSGAYTDLSWTPTLSTVATSWCYNDLTGKPTIPTDNCQLGNSCNYITKSVNNLDNYTPTTSLATVATSWAYCDLTGTPSLACVACSGNYEDLCCKPNLWVYQTTANMVCNLTNADNSHYPSAKAVADALSCAWAWDMLSGVYDPNNKAWDAFDYCNFINTPLLCAVATSGKYCDLTGLPTIPAALTAGNAICINSNCINVVCDNSTIKKNWSNQLYADFTWLATTASLCTVATSWKYCDLTGTPSLCTVATSWKYCDLTWQPIIPTDNCELANSCWYTTCTGTVVASDLNAYATNTSLCTVATSWKYCDLTGTPTIPTVNTKAFTLSSTSDTTNATAALTYINNWWTAIVVYNNIAYNLVSKSSSSLVFKSSPTATANASDTTLNVPTLAFAVSSNAVTTITAGNTSLGKFLETDRNYWTAYTPSYNWSPATKKYVDDCVWAINSAEWWCITGTLACQTDLNNILNCKAQCCDIPTDNCQLANTCGYTTCTGTLSASNAGTDWQVLTLASWVATWCDAAWWWWDMAYCDFNWVTKSWASFNLDLSSEITPTANFTVNIPTSIKQWQSYVLRVNNWPTPYTMTLGSCINNPNDMDLTLTANWTDQFVFYAVNSNELDLQMAAENEIIYVTQAEYNALPSSKNTDGKSYFIYE